MPVLSKSGPLAAVFAVLALFASAASAQQPQPQPQPTEQLTLQPPEGWSQAFHLRQGSTELVEFIPAGQTLENWRDMVVVQTLFGLKSMTPELYLGSATPGQMQENCEDPRFGEIQKGKPNGYNAAFQIVECPVNKRSGKGEISMFLVIQGEVNTYALQRAWQVEPFAESHHSVPKEALDKAVAYLRSVRLCDPANPAHPCK